MPQWYITFWATTKIGAVLVTVNTAYKIHEAEYLLRQSDTHTLVMIDGYKDSDYVGIIKELCPELAGRRARAAAALQAPALPAQCHHRGQPAARLLHLGGGHGAWREAVPVERGVAPRAARCDKHDVCNMQYTSGTTGFPKGVMLTHYNVVNNGKAIGDCMDLSTADRMMIQVPMFHCFGMVLAMTASMTHGTTMCPIPPSPRARAWTASTRSRSPAFHGVPTMFIAMLEPRGLCQDRFQPHAHRHHGGQPLPGQGDAGGGGEDAHDRDRASPTARPRPPPAAP